VFLRPENQTAISGIVKSLRQVKNLKTVMIHLRKGTSGGSGAKRGGGIRNGIWGSIHQVIDPKLP
jgi:DNA mismatch repair protein MSH5